MMNKYKAAGAAVAAAAAAVCFYTYFIGGEQMYGVTLILTSLAFGTVGFLELMTSRSGGAGSSGYMKPVLLFVLALLTLAAAVWYFAVRA